MCPLPVQPWGPAQAMLHVSEASGRVTFLLLSGSTKEEGGRELSTALNGHRQPFPDRAAEQEGYPCLACKYTRGSQSVLWRLLGTSGFF